MLLHIWLGRSKKTFGELFTCEKSGRHEGSDYCLKNFCQKLRRLKSNYIFSQISIFFQFFVYFYAKKFEAGKNSGLGKKLTFVSLFCAIFFTIWEQNFPLNKIIFLIRCLPIAFTLLTDVHSRLKKNLKTLKSSSGHVEFSSDNPAENC